MAPLMTCWAAASSSAHTPLDSVFKLQDTLQQLCEEGRPARFPGDSVWYLSIAGRGWEAEHSALATCSYGASLLRER